MSSRTEAELIYLEEEANALKVAFQRRANSLDVLTNTKANVSPPANQYSAQNTKVIASGTLSYMSGVRITLNSENGENVIAKIVPYARRVPFEGGAQWVYTGSPAVSVKFTIYSSAPGEINVEAI